MYERWGGGGEYWEPPHPFYQITKFTRLPSNSMFLESTFNDAFPRGQPVPTVVALCRVFVFVFAPDVGRICQLRSGCICAWIFPNYSQREAFRRRSLRKRASTCPLLEKTCLIKLALQFLRFVVALVLLSCVVLFALDNILKQRKHRAV